MASDGGAKAVWLFQHIAPAKYHSRWDNREYADEEEGPELRASMQSITLKKDGPRPLDLSDLIDLGPDLERRSRQGRHFAMVPNLTVSAENGDTSMSLGLACRSGCRFVSCVILEQADAAGATGTGK